MGESVFNMRFTARKRPEGFTSFQLYILNSLGDRFPIKATVSELNIVYE